MTYAMSVVNSLSQFISETWHLGIQGILPSLWWVYFKIRQKLEHYTFSSNKNTPYKTNTAHQGEKKEKKREFIISTMRNTKTQFPWGLSPNALLVLGKN